MATTVQHWGQWVAARSEAVGFKRQEDLAVAVGCTRERIARWMSMPTPPPRMRKGFDRSLASALRTSSEILFRNYAQTPPDAATFVWLAPGENLPWHQDSWKEVSVENRARIVAMMLGEAAEQWIAIGVVLADARAKAQRSEFEDQVLKNDYEKIAGYPPLPPGLSKQEIKKRRGE